MICQIINDANALHFQHEHKLFIQKYLKYCDGKLSKQLRLKGLARGPNGVNLEAAFPLLTQYRNHKAEIDLIIAQVRLYL